MNRKLFFTVWMLLGLGGGSALLAQKAITTSAPFLQIAPDARSGGMGDIGIALSPDANAIFWNSAKAAFDTSKAAVAANYIPWLKDLADDVYMASLAGNYKVNDHSALLIGVRYFNMGNINLTNDGTTILSTQRPRQYSIDAGYALKVSEHVGVGVTLKYIHSSLLGGTWSGKSYNSGSAVAGDIAVFYNKPDNQGQGLSAGVTLSNVGSKISYTDDVTAKYFLPANLGAGAAYRFALDEKSGLTISGEVNHLLVPAMDTANVSDYYNKTVLSGMGSSFSNKALSAAAGAEYSYNHQFFLRTGYHWESESAGGRHYFTAGAGFQLSTLGINFSYLAQSGNGINRNPLSNTFRFGLLFTVLQ